MNYREAIETIRKAANEADVDVDSELEEAERMLSSENLLQDEGNQGGAA